MIYKITIKHSTNYENRTNKILVGAKEIGESVGVALKKARDLGWKEAVVISSIELNAKK